MAAEQKPKKQKSGRKKKTKGSYYEESGAGVKRIKRSCPKCGSGVFMAEHPNRFACGKCSYTEWKQR